MLMYFHVINVDVGKSVSRSVSQSASKKVQQYQTFKQQFKQQPHLIGRGGGGVVKITPLFF